MESHQTYEIEESAQLKELLGKLLFLS